ncbi:MAG: HAMP domain-containing histidine kinase, partial [Lachnospiraceae bacterium]|nr:HAMP domain-containing histidine kinase [Lachnospiraceae bacterium]
MKNYNRLMILSLVVYAVLAVCVGMIGKEQQDESTKFYKVEINRILADIEAEVGRIDLGKTDIKMTDVSEKIKNIDLDSCHEVQSIVFLPVSETDKDVITNFYSGVNGKESMVYPLYFMHTPMQMKYATGVAHRRRASRGKAFPLLDYGNKASGQLAGYLRFDYQQAVFGRQFFFWIQGALFLMELFLLGVLFYLRAHLIQPFHRMQDITYELSKGNLQGEVKAEKNQFLGKFLWGLNELKDALYVSRKREMELQREKKMLLLSLSHDIKTPLNMIKLYGKALEDGMYPTDAERVKVYHQIREKAMQIENFVSEIMKASKEDIVHIEVEKGEFYLKELVQWIRMYYGEKCALRKCSLTIDEYQNRILQGDIHRLFEVFENLFANAFKYGDGRLIHISFYEEDYCQLIRVFNTGEPVSEKEFVHLFDSFFRGENTRGQQGNGLGLYICKEIMCKMGGDIFAECETEGM